MRSRALIASICWAISCGWPCANAYGQSPPPLEPPPDEQDRPQQRFVWMPTLALTSLGYDSNVWNLPSDPTRPDPARPGSSAAVRHEGDMVAALTAGLAPIWRVGEARLAADTTLTYNYFHRFVQERGFDAAARGRIDIPIARVKLHGAGSYQNVRQRVNFEIDERARRTESDAGAGLDVAVGAQARLGVRVRRAEVVFDDDRPEHETLRQTLNRVEQTTFGSFTYAVTPLTTWMVTGEAGDHEFDLSPGRNGRRRGVTTGVLFDRDALIAGQGTIGWRRVTVREPLIPAFSGLVGALDLSTVIGSATRIGARGGRDVTFSSAELSPYYVQTGAGGSITQALSERWEVGARMDRVWLNYVRSAAEVGPDYRERVHVIAGRVGFRFANGFRLSVEMESSRRRTSSDPRRSYDTVRIYTVISRGLGF